jgi:hypothetical protein
MLGAALRDENDGDALLAQRAEEPVRRARNPDHAGTLEIDERHVLDAGDALHRQERLRLGADEGSLLVWREGVAYPDWNGAAHGGRHGLRVNDLGAEIRKLHRLVVGERINHRGIGHAARIGG